MGVTAYHSVRRLTSLAFIGIMAGKLHRSLNDRQALLKASIVLLNVIPDGTTN